MTAAQLLDRFDLHDSTCSDKCTQSARATRFLELIPARLGEDLTFSFRVLRINRETGAEVVDALWRRLSLELRRGAVPFTHRADVTVLVQALKQHRGAAIELADYVSGQLTGGA